VPFLPNSRGGAFLPEMEQSLAPRRLSAEPDAGQVGASEGANYEA
jgi:hypothetical protein